MVAAKTTKGTFYSRKSFEDATSDSTMPTSELKILVYSDTVFSAAHSQLPGVELEHALQQGRLPSNAPPRKIQIALSLSCRKLCLMWEAGNRAQKAVEDWWPTTLHEAPTLWGGDAVTVLYHFEACILFARAALDIGAYVFGSLLPKPFPRNEYHSFAKLFNKIMHYGPDDLKSYLSLQRESPTNWVSLLVGDERGHSLRDRLAHLEEFPLSFAEIYPGSEREHPVLQIAGNTIPLQALLRSLLDGVVSGFLTLERSCIAGLPMA
jgi:hypothetical protein